MNNLLKLKTILRIVGIIALVAVIGFSFVACDNGTTGGDDDGADLKSKMVTFIIQNNTDEDVGNQSEQPVKINGVKVYFYPEDSMNNPESYLIGDTNTFDTTLIAEAGASVTIPAVNVSQYEWSFGDGGGEYPLVYVEVSREGGTSKVSTYVKPDFSTSDETFNLELWRGFGSQSGIHLSEVE